MSSHAIRLGVNIDHVATLRRLRDTSYPDLLEAAREVIGGGADQITVHLREDRRHIVDEDVYRLKREIQVDLNLEMAAKEEMLAIALEVAPHSICLVPEKREERTTEGGLDFSTPKRREVYAKLARAAGEQGIRPCFFIEPDPAHVKFSADLGARAVELHTGKMCLAHQGWDLERYEHERRRLLEAIEAGNKAGIALHAGHGIDFEIAPRLSDITDIVEYNIGHAIVCEAVFHGLAQATRKMKALLTSPHHP